MDRATSSSRTQAHTSKRALCKFVEVFQFSFSKLTPLNRPLLTEELRLYYNTRQLSEMSCSRLWSSNIFGAVKLKIIIYIRALKKTLLNYSYTASFIQHAGNHVILNSHPESGGWWGVWKKNRVTSRWNIKYGTADPGVFPHPFFPS